ncbi:MAG: DNA primase [Candidatus Saccharimonadales bacterium]
MDAKEEIRSRLSIEDVVGEYVQLKRAGRNWKGLSPFSAERTPSFIVSPDKQIWHDFSSGRGGDMFSFVMEMEGLEFRAALELLARRAGVDLEQYNQPGSGRTSGKSKDRLYEALELATHFYQMQFSQNKLALEYALGKRGFSKATALTWRLGYSPNNGSALCDFLVKKGFSADEIKLAGLSSQNYRGLGDMFRGRLQIPLCDPQGRVIGFTARLLEDNPNAPKYINTPATPLYDKSRHVFGLHLAKEAIRKNKYVVLAEGNLDVITSHQALVTQVVATAGTALTEPHLKALSRLTGDIRLSFDADKAGLAATERAIPIAAKVGVTLSIITIPSGKDPDELIRSDVSIWRDIITKPLYAVDWLIERYSSQLDLTTAVGKREFSDVVINVVRGLEDSVEQDHYIGELAKILQVNKDALNQKLVQPANKITPVRLKKPVDIKAIDKATVDRQKTEEHLMSVMLAQPKLRDYLKIVTPDMLEHEPAIKLLGFLKEFPDFAGFASLANKPKGADTEALRAWAVQDLGEYGKILSLVYETLYQDLELLELRYEVARLRAKLIEQYVRIKKHMIAENLNDAEGTAVDQLLHQAKQLDKLLKSLQGDKPRAQDK